MWFIKACSYFYQRAHVIVHYKDHTICLNSKIYSLQIIRPSLHPCLHGILMPMCLLRILLRIQHAYALEYDKPWLIQHYIQIFNMLVFSHSSEYAAHLYFLWDFRNRYGFFCKFHICKFNKNTLFFLLFSYLSSFITPQLKKHNVSVSSISLSFINHFKKQSYGALKNIDLYML